MVLEKNMEITLMIFRRNVNEYHHTATQQELQILKISWDGI